MKTNNKIKYAASLIVISIMLFLALGSSESSDKLDIQDCANRGSGPVIDELIENYKKDETKTIAQKNRVQNINKLNLPMQLAYVSNELRAIANPKITSLTESQAKDLNSKAYTYAFEELNGKTAEELADFVETNLSNSSSEKRLTEKWTKRLIEFYQSN